MTTNLPHLRVLTAKLRENLAKCAQNADVDAVHDTRTGTRRIEAMLETLLRVQTPAEGDDLYKAVHSLMRLLKKIRRAAAPVRDLDVHRRLLEKLAPKPPAQKAGEPQSAAPEPSPESSPAPSPEAVQAEDLDAWLKHQRQHHLPPLQKDAAKWAAKLEKRLAALETALTAPAARPGTGRRPASRAATVALDSFAILARQMQLLDAVNLHDFRKGAKKARYVAESGGEDAGAKLVGGALKRLQDEIGDWHDWLVLAEEAHSALGVDGRDLIAKLEAERDRHYVSAMKMAGRLRGRLMGEWLAHAPSGRTRTRRPAIARKSSP
jgi:CHAD domain-containing protein